MRYKHYIMKLISKTEAAQKLNKQKTDLELPKVRFHSTSAD